jgi:hypothetical protein
MAALPVAGHASAGAGAARTVVVVVGVVVVVVEVGVVVVVVEVVVVVVVDELAGAGLDTTSKPVNSPHARGTNSERRPNLNGAVTFTSLMYRLPAVVSGRSMTRSTDRPWRATIRDRMR